MADGALPGGGHAGNTEGKAGRHLPHMVAYLRPEMPFQAGRMAAAVILGLVLVLVQWNSEMPQHSVSGIDQ